MTHPIAKALCLAGAFVGGGSLSQYPEFAQQYTQRLAGQVDALGQVVADFDRSALAAIGRPECCAREPPPFYFYAALWRSVLPLPSGLSEAGSRNRVAASEGALKTFQDATNSCRLSFRGD